MASSKPDSLLILLQKLMEEGNMLYKVYYGECCRQRVGEDEANPAASWLNRLQTRCFVDWWSEMVFPLPVCFSEGTNEGGRPALPVCPEEATAWWPRRGAQRAQRPAGLPLPKPFPLPQENQRKVHSCNKLLVHYLTPAGSLEAERMAGAPARQDRRVLKIHHLSVSTLEDNVSTGIAHCKKIPAFQLSFQISLVNRTCTEDLEADGDIMNNCVLLVWR